MKRITIIGGGASGTLLAANLLRRKPLESITINLVEKRERVGLGVAYSTDKDTHLLNVPAAKMGAFPDNIGHFYEWLKANGHEYGESSFVPRKIFGKYLRDIFDEAARDKAENITFNVYGGEAVEINEDPAHVLLESGEIILSDKVVLAFGNFLPPQPTVEDQNFVDAEKYFQNPWSRDVYETIDPEDSVFIVGTGLSMVDVAMHFHRNEHRGKITAISTRGLLPAVHRLGQTYDSFYEAIRSHDRITDLLKAVRREIRRAEEKGIGWHAVIDSLRPHTQAIWQNLPVSEKRYFMQHLSRYWNVSRHRMPAEAAEVLDKMQADGRLEIMKGRLRKIETNGSGDFNIVFSSDGNEKQVSANAVVNCIGSESNFERIDSALVRNLLTKGYIRNDALSQGLDALPDGTIIGKNGAGSNFLHTLGTSLKGILWESTAIPEIRVQARDLAGILLSN